MTEIDSLAAAILQKYGSIKRARNCFLYTEKGIRLTDLYQESGRAILGWGGGSAFTIFKNVLNRGFTGSFDTDYTRRRETGSRLDRVVSQLLDSARVVLVFTSKQQAFAAALEMAPDSTSVWRPWNPEKQDWSTVHAVLLEPPLPWTAALWLVAVLPENDFSVSESSRIPAPIAAAVIRSLYDMIEALQNREEKNWFVYDRVVTRYWTRRGPYLYPNVPVEQYDNFVAHCLNCMLVISPYYDQPSIIPFGADVGVFRMLDKTPFSRE
jgi:hypothetical protein